MNQKANVVKHGFTFIEILVVTVIISLLATVTAVSYSQFAKQSRDAKRKSDLEQIRGALELFRSNNSTYPSYSIFTNGCIDDNGGCAQAPNNNVYMPRLPKDPKNPNYLYYYSGTSSDYTLATQLEGVSSCTSPPGSPNCGTGNPCNYCLGPYGEK